MDVRLMQEYRRHSLPCFNSCDNLNVMLKVARFDFALVMSQLYFACIFKTHAQREGTSDSELVLRSAHDVARD